MTELNIPEFATEAEEAAWWESNEEQLAAEFEKAVAAGLIDPNDSDLPFVSCPLDLDDITKAREQAARRGLRYQTYLKMIIHEALLKAESAG